MNGVFERIGLQVGQKQEKGVAVLSAFEIPKEKVNSIYNMRLIMEGGAMFALQPGNYVRLHINGELMMSDTPMERRSNTEFVRKANGHVLIAGLGVGLIINALEEKIKNGDVKSITVIEKYQDVIDLVADRFTHIKKLCPLNIVCSDIHDYKPGKDQKFDVIYFDIWPDISTDNLPEIATLHNKFKNTLNRQNKSYWMGSWMRDYLKRQQRRYSRSGW